MANYTLDFTGAEVNELLGQVAAGGSGGGGTMYVNVTAEGVDDSMQFIGVNADKTMEEIKEAITNGEHIVVAFDLSAIGQSGVHQYLALISSYGEDVGYGFEFAMTLFSGSNVVTFSVSANSELGWSGLMGAIPLA